LHNGKKILHFVAYYSKKLTDIQTRYFAQKRELLAIMLFLQHWRHWVEGGDIIVITNHNNLKIFNTKAELLARIVRFLDAIKHFGARVLYRPGKANMLADYLSKSPELAHIGDKRKERDKQIIRPKYLNKLDLQAIFEHIAYD
jgi:hypothetical protein